MKAQLLKPIRVFLAIDLDENSRNTFQKIITTLKAQPQYKHIRWSQVKNLHMTVQFLGQLSPTKVPVLTEQLRKAARAIPPFKIQFDRVLLFPSKQKPQVIAVDVQYSQMLQNIFQMVENEVTAFGFTPDKKTQRPHITVGRFKEKQVPEIDINLAPMNVTMMVNNITLFQSIQLEKGSRYDILEKIELGKNV